MPCAVLTGADAYADRGAGATLPRPNRMARPSLRLIVIAALGLAMAAPAHAADGTVCDENATIGDLQEALASGKTTAAALTRSYLARVEAYDKAGIRLNAVREVNPDAPAIAAALDGNKHTQRRPLEGIPILVKDNI